MGPQEGLIQVLQQEWNGCNPTQANGNLSMMTLVLVLVLQLLDSFTFRINTGLTQNEVLGGRSSHSLILI